MLDDNLLRWFLKKSKAFTLTRRCQSSQEDEKTKVPHPMLKSPGSRCMETHRYVCKSSFLYRTIHKRHWKPEWRSFQRMNEWMKTTQSWGRAHHLTGIRWWNATSEQGSGLKKVCLFVPYINGARGGWFPLKITVYNGSGIQEQPSRLGSKISFSLERVLPRQASSALAARPSVWENPQQQEGLWKAWHESNEFLEERNLVFPWY